MTICKKPKRGLFASKQDHNHAVQVWALVKLALEKGASREEVDAILKQHWGGFISWDWLWEK